MFACPSWNKIKKFDFLEGKKNNKVYLDEVIQDLTAEAEGRPRSLKRLRSPMLHFSCELQLKNVGHSHLNNRSLCVKTFIRNLEPTSIFVVLSKPPLAAFLKETKTPAL